jgi:hypothetical protein
MPDIIDIPGQATLPANDYAEKYGISRRTVNRYIQAGKIEAVRRTGRTYIIDQSPTKTPIESEPVRRLDNQDAESSQIIKRPDDYPLKLDQLSAQVKSGYRWRHLAIGLIITVCIAAPALVWLYLIWQDTADALTISQDTTTKITADMANATTTIKQLRDDLLKSLATANALAAEAATAKSYKEVNKSLQENLDAERKRSEYFSATVSKLSLRLSQTASIATEPNIATAPNMATEPNIATQPNTDVVLKRPGRP